ncbi:unnamed protein product [Pleuronectes platessa]|uniref:Uncharacterized protein n=1 Tax=Pleuronectes platessa TaxID=8262 RepID=A0A9N7Z8Z5_PLEPL|nr:unnamed protein product [Pleuronectes platessa]
MDHSCSQSAPSPNLEQSELSLAGPTADTKPTSHSQAAGKSETKRLCSQGRPQTTGDRETPGRAYSQRKASHYCCSNSLPGIILDRTEGAAGDLDRQRSNDGVPFVHSPKVISSINTSLNLEAWRDEATVTPPRLRRKANVGPCHTIWVHHAWCQVPCGDRQNALPDCHVTRGPGSSRCTCSNVAPNHMAPRNQLTPPLIASDKAGLGGTTGGVRARREQPAITQIPRDRSWVPRAALCALPLQRHRPRCVPTGPHQPHELV